MSWGGAAGTWFWIDPTNDVIFVGMIQRMGGTGRRRPGTMARTLTFNGRFIRAPGTQRKSTCLALVSLVSFVLLDCADWNSLQAFGEAIE